MVVGMTRLSSKSPEYELYERKFLQGWRHDNKSARIHSIFRADTTELLSSRRGIRFSSYMSANGGRFSTRFHGTQRACYVGEKGDRLRFCKNDDCFLCMILWSSFKVNYANRGMFGAGIYSTTCSSKADRYAHNHYIRSRLHAVLICRVVCTRPQELIYPEKDRVEPDPPFNCVEALTKSRDPQGIVNYPETVVYRNDAIVPVGVIMYTREGWEPRH